MEEIDNRNKSNDRILVLAAIEGEKALDTSYKPDPRLFTGENKLHARMDIHSMLWYLQYDSGILPQPLQQRFTSFSKLLDFVSKYFHKRNIEIVKVID